MLLDEVDEQDMLDLTRVVRAYCQEELEVQVGVRDGKYYALRSSAGELGFPSSVLGALLSGRKKWRRILGVTWNPAI